MKLDINPKKRVVTVQKADGTVTATGQVRRRFIGIGYWSDYIEFDSPYEADKWVENPDFMLMSNQFPEVTWENSPCEAEIVLKPTLQEDIKQ